MGIITQMRRQQAVYWAALRSDSQGRSVLDVPVQIKCRWENGTVTFLDANGESQVGNSTVYVDRDVTLRGFLFLGLLADAPVDPASDIRCSEIRHYTTLPKLRGSEVLRTVIV